MGSLSIFGDDGSYFFTNAAVPTSGGDLSPWPAEESDHLLTEQFVLDM